MHIIEALGRIFLSSLFLIEGVKKFFLQEETIIYMEDGLILEIGSHKELMEIENGRYHQLHQEQFANVEQLN